MADQQPPDGDTRFVHDQVAHLAVHFPDGGRRLLAIIRRPAETRRPAFLPELEIRHVDIKDAIQNFDRIGAVIATGIVNERNIQSLPDGNDEGLQYLGDHMARRDEVDVVASQFHETQHHGGQALGFHLLALSQMADLEILAEGTAEIAGTEENRSGTGRPDQRGFFAEMGMKARHSGPRACPADALFAGKTIHMARPRTEAAVLQQFQGLLSPGRQQSLPVKLEIGRLAAVCLHGITPLNDLSFSPKQR